MERQYRFVLAGLAFFLWFAVAGVGCQTNRGREKLVQSYRLARFNLEACRDMGAREANPVTLEQGARLGSEIEKLLAARRWSRAAEAIGHLEETVAALLERMKDRDADGDGLSNYAEYMLYGTLWQSPDSDGDGYVDGDEVLRYGTDPLDHCAVPIDVPREVPVRRPCPALE
jgi:hypothetical protein